MKTLFFETLYGVEQIVFNVGENNDVKTHRDPITGIEYAFASSANVKRNLKELFSTLSKIDTPIIEFKKNLKVNDKEKTVYVDAESGEQGGVSVKLDENDPNLIGVIFGAWNSDVSSETEKYVKFAIKSCVNIGDMLPVHSRLQRLSKKDVGVFCGDKNSVISLGDKTHTFYRPEDIVEFANCSIDDAKKMFSGQRAMNLYEDKRTANGIYQETFTIDIEKFGKIKLSSWKLSDEAIETLVSNGWRLMDINGEKYISPSREQLMALWACFAKALINWDFSSNNSLHGNVKEPLRYSISMNGSKIKQCNTAHKFINENGKEDAVLSLNECKEVVSFNTKLLEKWHICDGSDGKKPIETNIDADEEAMECLIKMGEEHIL